MITVQITAPGVTHAPITYGVVQTHAPIQRDPPGSIQFQATTPMNGGRVVLLPGTEVAAYLLTYPEARQLERDWEPFVAGYMTAFVTQMAKWEALAALMDQALKTDNVSGPYKFVLRDALKAIGRTK